VKILYVEPIGVRGGMGHYNEALVTAYGMAGAHVDYVTSSDDPSYELPARAHVSKAFALAMDRAKPKVLRAVGYVSGYIGCLRLARGTDAVVFNFMHRPSIDRWALKAFRRAGRRLVLIAHDPEPVLATQRGGAYQQCLGMFDIVVVHGPAARKDIIALGVDANRVVLASHGEFRPAKPLDRAEAQSALGLGHIDSPVAAIIGNLRPCKGIRRAREALDAPGTTVRTLLVAGSQQGDWDLQGALLQSDIGPVKVVRVDRRLSDTEECAAYSLADVVLALYESGYSSGVISRAHSIGRPVVLTNVGDLAIQARSTDAIVPADYTAEQLRKAIEKCLSAGTQPPSEWEMEPWRDHAREVMARL
jgi:hypothetical protein